MPFATFEGEGSVEEIADRLFVRLTPKQRETATKAILKANPRLSEIGTLKPGVIIDVPDIPSLRDKAAEREEGQSPDREVLTAIHAATKELAGRLLDRHGRDAGRVKEEMGALADPALRKAIGRSEALLALADGAARELELRAKTADERRKGIETAVSRALADLETRMKG